MSCLVLPVAALIEELSKLPGVGVKTAQRLTFFILRSPADQARRLAEAIMRVKESIIYCSRCFNITENDPCLICAVTQPRSGKHLRGGGAAGRAGAGKDRSV